MTALGLCLYALHARDKRAACDVVLAVLGAYVGLVDGWVVVWTQGNPRIAAFRVVSSGLLSAARLAGWTAGCGVIRGPGGRGVMMMMMMAI
jgi:hypothetical protein